ncbi:MAG TPA: TolC family protein, partial [Usitatibacter sp.]|nr:TolC family protein [Usitatibacter sp.]
MTFRRTLLAAALALSASGASAADLLAIYHDAQVSDPVYQSARAQYNASVEALPQARAGYLPLVSGTASVFRNYVDEEIAGRFNYTTKTYAVTLSQPIFRLQNWIAINQAQNLVLQAEAVLASSLQDLAIRSS